MLERNTFCFVLSVSAEACSDGHSSSKAHQKLIKLFFPALVQLHCTHQLSSHLLMVLHHSPIYLSPPLTFVSPIHHSLSQEQFKKSSPPPPYPQILDCQDEWQILTPSWISQSLHLPTTLFYVPLHLPVSSLGWTLPSAVVLPVESSSLSALPAGQEVALTPHATAFLLSALVADLALEQLIL